VAVLRELPTDIAVNLVGFNSHTGFLAATATMAKQDLVPDLALR